MKALLHYILGRYYHPLLDAFAVKDHMLVLKGRMMYCPVCHYERAIDTV